MELKLGQRVLLVTEKNTIRGRVGATPTTPTTPLGDDEEPKLFIELIEATILDPEGRIDRKVSKVHVNPRYIIYWMEDEHAVRAAKVKMMIDREDYESALGELTPLLGETEGDGDLYYLAGIAYRAMGSTEEASVAFTKALGYTKDPRLRAVIQRHLDGA